MSISGFTFIKNGLSLGYPILESILSIERFCDEVVVNVGFNNQNLSQDDGTHDYLRDHLKGSKYKFLKSYWDPEKTKQGLVLSEQTNIALAKCSHQYCQYIQADEIVHEDDIKIIEEDLKVLEEDSQLLGLAFRYHHFYGSPDIVRHTKNTYRREVRLIKNHQGILSHLDAQGFRKKGEKFISLESSARIFHYGWARSEILMNKKNVEFHKLYHGKDFQAAPYEYAKVWGLKKFTGTHPKVMKDWIEKNKNTLDILGLPLKWEKNTLRYMISDFIESLSGVRLGEYKSYLKK
jgi:hypothetical protein